ncbi:MAG: hypothetical protein P4L46_22415 [Fimbriimonas sp.]|nr:hypothetical protein [Fimbriimonas sp.]
MKLTHGRNVSGDVTCVAWSYTGYIGCVGILSEFFVSDPGRAATYDLEAWTEDDIFLCGDLLPMHMELLWAVLQGREWEPEMADEFEPVAGRNEEDSWLVRFPDGLTAALAEFDDDRLNRARVDWAHTEEIAVDPAELAHVISGLQRLSKHARTTGKSVYIWGSL